MNAWAFVDALLEESERKNEPCSFPPMQVTKLREMIAEIPTELAVEKEHDLAKTVLSMWLVLYVYLRIYLLGSKSWQSIKMYHLM